MGALMPGSASAILITSLNAPVGFSLSENVGGGLVLNATGSVSVTSGFNSSFLTLHVVLNNTSTQNGVPVTAAANVRLTGWGFGVDPDATGVVFANSTPGGLIDASLDNLPSLAAIEVCAWGGNNCSGGANGGIQGGSNDTFDLILAGHWANTITFDPLGVRFQTAVGSFDFACPPNCGGTASGDAPEPQTLALVALALLGLTTLFRRKAAKR